MGEFREIIRTYARMAIPAILKRHDKLVRSERTEKIRNRTVMNFRTPAIAALASLALSACATV